MKAKVLQRSRITRYDGSFSSLSAFLLAPVHTECDVETADVRAEGVFLNTEEGLSLTYKEEESGVSVKVEKRDDTLTVTRGGAVLSFRLGATTSFVYNTLYGTLPMEAYTEEITLDEKGNARLLTLIYTAVFGGMAQKNEMRFKITL